jgi:putative membrane protein
MTPNPEKSTPRTARPFGRTLAAAAVCAFALAAVPAGAQGTSGSATSGSSTSGTGTASGAPGVTSSGAPRAAGSSAAGTGSMVSRDDSKMMADLAHANIAEIETGKMALEKSQSDQVKKFAQHMIDDHTSALKELQTLAQAKGVTLPDGTDLKHKTMAAALKVMTGNSFDSQYMKRVGVGDHEETIELLQKAQKNAKDPELKAMATKMLPTVREHLKMAQQGVTAVSTKK